MIPTKARPTQMNAELLEYCKKKIQTLLDKQLIRPSNLLGIMQHSMLTIMLRKNEESPALSLTTNP